MRTKFGLERRDEWRCAFCCHVRTGTILLGIWHLILHVLAFAVIAVVLIHPELIDKPHDSSADQPLLSVEQQKIRVYEYHYEYSFFKDCKWTTHDINAGMAVTFCTFLITLLMVYGAVKGNPRYLMPFFCLQVFDFCVASLTVIGYFSYMPDAHQTIAENPNIPFHKEMLKLDTQWQSVIFLLIFIFLMMVKAYFIGVVWSCYKYLVYRNASNTVAEYVDNDTKILLPPPDYETVTKDTKHLPLYSAPIPPPPPYAPREETI